MKIVLAPDEVLRSPTKPIEQNYPNLSKILSDMKETLLAQKDPQGVGLAANQVGLPLQIFLARYTAKKNEPIHVFINPKILSHSEDLQDDDDDDGSLEGCLSIPQFYGFVKRWKWVEVSYQGYDWETNKVTPSVTEKFTKFPAVVIQHEIDHLNGHVFVEKILEQNGKLYKIVGKDKKGKEIWEEVRL